MAALDVTYVFTVRELPLVVIVTRKVNIVHLERFGNFPVDQRVTWLASTVGIPTVGRARRLQNYTTHALIIDRH